MSKALAALVIVTALLVLAQPEVVSKDPLDVPYRYAYEMYKTFYNKQWNLQETKYRVSIFRANVIRYEEFNKKPNNTYKMGLSQFSDLTQQEFAATYLDLIAPTEVNTALPDLVTPKTALTWKYRNFTQPRDQGSCGSSWAYAAVAMIESVFLN